MTVITRNAPLTQNQQIALGYVYSPRDRALEQAIINLQNDKDGTIAPASEWIIEKIISEAIKRGRYTALDLAYHSRKDGREPSEGECRKCAKNALKNLDVFQAVAAYRKIDAIPKKMTKKVLDQVVDKMIFSEINFVKLRSLFNTYEELNLEIPKRLIILVNSWHYTELYIKICKLKNQLPDNTVIVSSFDYWVEKFNPYQAEYAADLLGKTLTKSFLLKVGKKAFQAGMDAEGKEFFEMAYKTKDERFFK